jgi:DNA-binding LacI/PurR family transcriptional regulator
VTYPVTRHRWNGYLDAWREAGGDPAGLRVAVCQANATGLGEAFAEELLRGDDPPDAIAAMSDELALGAVRAADRAGVALPITGWDDSEAAAAAGLTTLAQSLHEQGMRCAQLALGNATPSADDQRAEWQVIERRSTG